MFDYILKQQDLIYTQSCQLDAVAAFGKNPCIPKNTQVLMFY